MCRGYSYKLLPPNITVYRTIWEKKVIFTSILLSTIVWAHNILSIVRNPVDWFDPKVMCYFNISAVKPTFTFWPFVGPLISMGTYCIWCIWRNHFSHIFVLVAFHCQFLNNLIDWLVGGQFSFFSGIFSYLLLVLKSKVSPFVLVLTLTGLLCKHPCLST